MQIYIHKDEHDFGPFSREAVLEYVRRGVFQPEDYAALPGMTEWKPLGKLLGISDPSDTSRLLDSSRRASPEMAEYMRQTAPDEAEPDLPPPSRWSIGGKRLLIGANVGVALVIAAVICMRLQVIRQKRAPLDIAAAAAAMDKGQPSAIPGAPAPAAFASASPAVVASASPVAVASASLAAVAAASAAPMSAVSPAADKTMAAAQGSGSANAVMAQAVPTASSATTSASAAPLVSASAVAAASAMPALDAAAAAMPGVSITTSTMPSTAAATPAQSPALAAASPAATPASPPIAESTPAPAAPTPFDLTALAANRAAWPKSVRLKQPIPFPAVLDGQVVGSLTVPAGATVRLDNMQGGFLTLNFQGGAQRVAWQYTTIQEQTAAPGAAPTPAAQGVTTASNIVSPPAN
jgi:hypothetical protein